MHTIISYNLNKREKSQEHVLIFSLFIFLFSKTSILCMHGSLKKYKISRDAQKNRRHNCGLIISNKYMHIINFHISTQVWAKLTHH